MIDLVQKRTSEQILAGHFEGLACDIAGAHHRLFGAAHRLAKSGDAQAPFFAGLLAFLRDYFGIDENDPLRFLPFLGPGDIDHRDPFSKVDLGRCQSYAMRSSHVISNMSSTSVCSAGVLYSPSATGAAGFSRIGLFNHRTTL